MVFSPIAPQSPAIILVEPRSPGNIGMVCRAMANFGATDLRLVNPCQHLHPEAHKFAVFAQELLGRARVYPDLTAALADLHLSVATTRRGGRLRGDPVPAAGVPALLRGFPLGTRFGLVFGREDAGLTSAEVALCTHASAIPTAVDGSLNLAQAVLVYLYELSRTAGAEMIEGQNSRELPTQDEVEAMFGQMEGVLERIGFLNSARPQVRSGQLRQLLLRARPSRGEISLLRGLWDQLAWSINDWRGRRRGTKIDESH
ncbi:MAG: RNA methyltransferase [Desulfuromonadales bacterium]|nr:RNA methyltransferase [Desulfuromonadales bacterium]